MRLCERVVGSEKLAGDVYILITRLTPRWLDWEWRRSEIPQHSCNYCGNGILIPAVTSLLSTIHVEAQLDPCPGYWPYNL